MASAIGLIKVASPNEVIAEREAEGESLEAVNPEELLGGIARHVRQCWYEAKHYKDLDRDRFVEAMYSRRGKYTPAKMQEIQKAGASTEYARIVANKARILESWLEDIFLAQSEPPWTISATPSPDLPDDLEERARQEVSVEIAGRLASGEKIDPMDAQTFLSDRIDSERSRLKDLADRRAERMQKKIADQLQEGGFYTALPDFFAYLTTYPGAILKGPIFRRRERVSWAEVEGTFIPEIQSEIVMEFEAVNPFNAYPAPGAESPQDAYFIEYLTLSYTDLYDLIGMSDHGYDEAAIRTILDRAANGGYRWLDPHHGEGADADSTSHVRHTTNQASYIDVLEYHGPILGRDLQEWGANGVVDEQRYYEATVWLIDDQVIKAVLNDDPMGRRPYYKACYEDIPGQFWGYSLHDVLSDVEGVANAAIRSLVNNMAIASGPQVIVNVDRQPPGESIDALYPWKIWQVNDSSMGNTQNPPIDFYQPPANVEQLSGVLERFYALADDFSLIPRYMSGSDKMSGPGRTASGLSMLLDAANKGLKSIVQGIDQNVMTQLLEQIFDHNMLHSDDESIKGDSQVVARGVSSLMQLETLRMRRNEFLQITANPIDSQIVGMEGRASVLREIAKGLGMDVNQVVPPKTQVQQQAQMAPPGGSPAAGTPPSPGQAPSPSGEQLQDGTPTADFLSPSSSV